MQYTLKEAACQYCAFRIASEVVVSEPTTAVHHLLKRAVSE